MTAFKLGKVGHAKDYGPTKMTTRSKKGSTRGGKTGSTGSITSTKTPNQQQDKEKSKKRKPLLHHQKKMSLPNLTLEPSQKKKNLGTER